MLTDLNSGCANGRECKESNGVLEVIVVVLEEVEEEQAAERVECP